jgi:hypothetical protein
LKPGYKVDRFKGQASQAKGLTWIQLPIFASPIARPQEIRFISELPTSAAEGGEAGWGLPAALPPSLSSGADAALPKLLFFSTDMARGGGYDGGGDGTERRWWRFGRARKAFHASAFWEQELW